MTYCLTDQFTSLADFSGDGSDEPYEHGREYPAVIVCNADLGGMYPLTLFNFNVIAFCSAATLHSVELDCITSNLADVAFNERMNE